SSGAEGVLWLDLLTKDHVDDLAIVIQKMSGISLEDITKTTTTTPSGTSTTTYVVVGLVIIIIAGAAWYFTKKK
ncbi:LPXTG cell wall anchor domain-containing protein, partial [Thermococcus sp. CX2]|uniref:LPXTG cell wall anchor domain-containing protein n=1 Tax=Thermococcus sp. CX2 TaxID=163006 RepID=UPI001F0D215C